MGASTLFLLLGLLLEGIFRMPWVQSRLPFQAYGINHIQFEYQLMRLQDFTRRYGAPDCFILGTSQSLRGIDPEILNPALQSSSGEKLTCYNFSIVGVNMSTNLLFAEILVQEYHPRLFIIGTSFLDYTTSRENRYDPRFEESAWVKYKLGHLNLQGWLIEHSYAYRAVLYLSYAAPAFMDFSEVHNEERKWGFQLSEYGYGYSDHAIDLDEPLTEAFINNFLEQFGDFGLSTWNLDSLNAIAELAAENGITLVLVEMPYTSTLVELRGEDGTAHAYSQTLQDFIARANARLEEIARQYHLPFWKAPSHLAYPPDAWHDLYHLNVHGSPLFTRWLAEQLDEALQSGAIELKQANKEK